MKNKIVAAKNRTTAFVARHKTVITVAATAAPLVALHVRNTQQLNEFLAERGLYDEYYQMNEI